MEDTSVECTNSAVFRYHQINNLQAPGLFRRSRGQIKYVVTLGASGSRYESGSDLIYIGNYWNGYGRFTTPHEYHHAFHYTAIDPWRTYQCVDNDHGFYTYETTSCAYIEGFADFFSFWMQRNDTDPTKLFLNDGIESNPNNGGNQPGIIVEVFFAATLWDLVDDASTPDDYSGDDDTMALTPSNVADIMLRCRLINPNEYLISHTDQFVYCAEFGVMNAAWSLPAALQAFWGPYGSMSWDGGTPILPNFSAFRANWRKNFYAL